MAKAKAKDETLDMETIPEPQLPRGRASGGKYAGKTFIANPKLEGNPRRAGSHGYCFHEKVREAGEEGIGYEDLRKACDADETLTGFGNHLKWDLERHFILVKEDLES